jgi:hypothetical protein
MVPQVQGHARRFCCCFIFNHQISLRVSVVDLGEGDDNRLFEPIIGLCAAAKMRSTTSFFHTLRIYHLFAHAIHHQQCFALLPAVPIHMSYTPGHLRERVPKHVHRHRCRAPVRARIRELVRQPSKVRPDHRVTSDAWLHERAPLHARKCSHEGAAHAQVPQGGDGLQRERRGVYVVVRIREVRRAAHTCRTSHASHVRPTATRSKLHLESPWHPRAGAPMGRSSAHAATGTSGDCTSLSRAHR